MPPSRSFSFEDDTNDGHPSHNQTRYHDSPQRPGMSITAAPQYFLPQTPSEPVSPVSAYRPVSYHSRDSSRNEPSFDVPRRSFVISNNTAAAVPPVPPPHRQSPTRSPKRKPVSNEGFSMDRPVTSPSHDNRVTEEAYHNTSRSQRQSTDANRVMPSSVAQIYHPANRDPAPPDNSYPHGPLSRTFEGGSSASGIPLTAAAAAPGAATPHEEYLDAGSSHHSMHSQPLPYPRGPIETFDDSPYQRPGFHAKHNVQDADILPHNIIDDGDDGFIPKPKRKSVLPLGRERSRSREVPGKGGTVTAVGIGGALFGRKDKAVTSSGSYNAVSASDMAVSEKSEWLSRQTVGKRRMRWSLGIIIGSVIILAVIGGIVGGVLGANNSSSDKKGGSGGGSINNAAEDTAANGDLDINSAEIKALMNNKNLHKVFPGMDYTPWGVQYPLCLTYPPSQNNVTRDMAIISQLTNAVRLYGTDCNQTEMVLHAIDRLQLNDMKVWLGVWVDNNATTTQRQLDQMYRILDDVKDHSIFAGVIIGNEALYRAGEDKAQSEQELITILTDAKSNFTSLNYDLTISTSDLGDNWSSSLVQASHYVMSNVHPFFAGVDVEIAAGWTWDFWQMKDVALTSGDESRQIIAETGWPSGGGTDCGNAENVCAADQVGAVASVDNMNKFMGDWVCQALENGTHYFWFSAFDEAWKISYNEPGKEWEDKWGLMDTARNLKKGLLIPDCGGKTV